MGQGADADRWRVIESLFEAALQRPGAERDTYLRDACASDQDLYREVAGLLAHAPASGEPPRTWAAAAAAQLITQPAALEPGDRLGPYEILSFLASGGMGAVYRSRDPRMGRDVAIKVSAEQFSERFAREVRAIAALNHPNVCTVHDVGPDYLVMELVEGETLADRLQRRGALPWDEALTIARQIAAGLEVAHDRGITHRDLKPGNIRIRPDGSVKVLDFGLANMAEPAAEEANSVTNSPTLGKSLPGTIVGTAAYMAPEQARGKPVDKRADIWAFGVILFEMLSGTRAYTGEMLTDVVAAVITRGPDWSVLPASTPPPVRDVLELCLQRDPRDRLHDIADARILLERYASNSRDPTNAQRTMAGPVTAWRALPWIAAAVLAAAAATVGVLYLRHAIEEQRLVTLSLLPPERGTFFAANPPAVSPDGRQIAFTVERDGRQSLWIRDLDTSTARELPGTEGARLPFWRPDGRAIAFLAGGKLKRIDPSGSGTALTLCDADQLRGGSWSKEDVLLFGAGDGELFRIPAAGGAVAQVTALQKAQPEIRHGFPWFLPDGRHFLYTIVSSDPSQSGVFVGDLNSNTHRRVVPVISNSAYVSPGFLLYAREGVLWAQPFDASAEAVSGDAKPVAENVDWGAGRGQPRYGFSASENGILAYRADSQVSSQLTLYDRSGKVLGTMGDPARIGYGVFSPDGRTIAFDRGDPQTPFKSDIWLQDLVRGGESRLTTNGRFNSSPVWSPDGHVVAFNSGRPITESVNNRPTPYRQSINGTSQEETFETAGTGVVTDWSRDGQYLVQNRQSERRDRDIWVVPLDARRKPYPYLATSFNESNARLSSDGKWVTYVSDETSQSEVYVDSFPQRSHKRQVSIRGGDRPVWSRSGKELFFMGADQMIMAAGIRDRGDELDIDVPQPLFPVRVAMGLRSERTWFDISEDGRFLIPALTDRAGPVPMTVVVNWPTLIR